MSRGAWILLAALAGALLFVSALSLVGAQHRARSLFVDLERAQAEARNRDVEWNRLRIELARAAQPAYVEQAARQLGLRPVDTARTVPAILPAPAATGAAP
jgi:cell division protein FtsL